MSANSATSSPADSYYGQPVIKQPTWTPEIPFYLFSGGLGGASAGLGLLAGLRGNRRLARSAWACALVGVAASPPLLISDLGYPSRFLNMLRMFKPTSPMSVGSWILAGSGATTTLAAANDLLGWPGGAARLAKPLAALLGLPLSTYTGALLAQTAVPVWHEARGELPFVFAAGAALSAGAAATLTTPPQAAGAARRLTLAGAAAELGTVRLMKRRLGRHREVYEQGAAGTLGHLAEGMIAAGASLVAIGGRRRRALTLTGAGFALGGALVERWSIFRAGFQSAADPAYTVGPQRERIASGASAGASRGFAVSANGA